MEQRPCSTSSDLVVVDVSSLSAAPEEMRIVPLYRELGPFSSKATGAIRYGTDRIVVVGSSERSVAIEEPGYDRSVESVAFSRARFAEGFVLGLDLSGTVRDRYWLRSGGDSHLNGIADLGDSIVLGGSIAGRAGWAVLKYVTE